MMLYKCFKCYCHLVASLYMRHFSASFFFLHRNSVFHSCFSNMSTTTTPNLKRNGIYILLANNSVDKASFKASYLFVTKWIMAVSQHIPKTYSKSPNLIHKEPVWLQVLIPTNQEPLTAPPPTLAG